MNDDSGQSGSTDWHNNVRNRLFLKTDDEDGDRRILKPMKSNYGPKGAEISLRWDNGVFVYERTHDPMRDRSDDEKVFDGIKRLLAKNRCLSASKNAGNYVVKLLKETKASGCQDMTRDRIQTAFDRLLESERVIIGQRGRSDYNVEVPV